MDVMLRRVRICIPCPVWHPKGGDRHLAWAQGWNVVAQPLPHAQELVEPGSPQAALTPLPREGAAVSPSCCEHTLV